MSRKYRRMLCVLIVLLLVLAALVALRTQRYIYEVRNPAPATITVYCPDATAPPTPNLSMSYGACSTSPRTHTVNVIHDVKVTYYCCEEYTHICNDGWPWRTVTGTKPKPFYTCAVDPDVIPLGSTVVVHLDDGTIYHLVAEDTGGGIDGNEIDVAVSTHWWALQYGVTHGDVYYITQAKEVTYD